MQVSCEVLKRFKSGMQTDPLELRVAKEECMIRDQLMGV